MPMHRQSISYRLATEKGWWMGRLNCCRAQPGEPHIYKSVWLPEIEEIQHVVMTGTNKQRLENLINNEK